MTYETPSHGSSRLEDTSPPLGEHVTENRHYDFFIVDNAVVDIYLPKIGPYAFAIYCYLVRRAGNKKAAYPSIGRMARECKMDDKTVRTCLQKLQETGLIGITARHSTLGDQSTNLYSVNPVKCNSPESVRPGVGDLTGGGGGNGGRHEEDSVKKTPPPTPQGGEVAGDDANASEEPTPYIEELKRFAAYRASLFDYFGRPETPKEWSEVEETVRGWATRGLPPLPPEVFHRYCIEERDKIRAKGDGMPRYTKPLLTRIALAASKIMGNGE
jgi:hypothetical protein